MGSASKAGNKERPVRRTAAGLPGRRYRGYGTENQSRMVGVMSVVQQQQQQKTQKSVSKEKISKNISGAVTSEICGFVTFYLNYI